MTNARGWCRPGVVGILAVWLAVIGIAPAGAQIITPSPFWRNTIEYAVDPFIVAPADPNDPAWVKFSIFLSSPGTVYFQDSNHYPFHLNFARERLDPYLGIDAAAFNAITLRNAGQQLQLGAVLFPPGARQGVGPREFAVQFIKTDVMPVQDVITYFNTVRTRVHADPAATALYFPTFEQAALAQSNAALLAANGITVSDPARWTTGNRTYATGFALGTLKFVTASGVTAAYNAGTLRPQDILLTDGVPAELPLVAGIITLAPATANSHVVLLAQTYGSPMVYLAVAESVQGAQALVGHEVLLSSYVVSDTSRITLIDAAGISPAFRSQLAALHGTGTIQYTPAQRRNAYVVNTADLTPADLRYTGGKASNYGYLRRAVAGNSRPAAAITFDAWNDYMDQPIFTGRTLRQEIHARLDAYQWPPDFASLSTALNGVRALFTSTTATQFNPSLTAAIMGGLIDPVFGFDPNVKLRFRSSTNVEDLSSFTGAGLYDSFSGCYHDDSDTDSGGPSWCDPADASEKGIFRAIRKVYASFYNDNAFSQRLRAGVNEDQVGMALLVHHSFPDATEMANGVVLWDRTLSQPSPMNIVTQLGADSVTNPTGGSIPEEVRIDFFAPSFWFCLMQRPSNRVMLGESVMPFPTTYQVLGSLMTQVGNRIAMETGDDTSKLDFEFKRVTPNGDIDLKQVRKVYTPSTVPSITPALVSTTTRYCPFQGEYGDVLSNHRLKARLDATTRNTLLSPQQVQSSLYESLTLTYNDGCSVAALSGPPAGFLGGVHAFGDATATDAWTANSMNSAAFFVLSATGVPTLVSPAQAPVLTGRDFGDGPRGTLTLSAIRTRPVTTVDDFNNLHEVSADSALLCPCETLTRGPLQHQVFNIAGGITIDTQYYWVIPPVFAENFYTADLSAWDRTIITGLTTQPIELRGEFSQSYRPAHHNQAEWFVFEPRLDPALTPTQRSELEARGFVRVMLFRHNLEHFDIVTLFGDPACPVACSADYNDDGDIGTDQDIEAFFACLAGRCCATCPPTADYNHDGDIGTDADIEAFFRVLAGGSC